MAHGLLNERLMTPHTCMKVGRAALRGVTLVEVLVVVAIMALVAAGASVAVVGRWNHARQKTTETQVRNLCAAVKTWWVEGGTSSCPAVEELIDAGVLDRDSARRDPWGHEWQLECTAGDVTVISPGRDGQLGTDDDIRIPPRMTSFVAGG